MPSLAGPWVCPTSLNSLDAQRVEGVAEELSENSPHSGSWVTTHRLEFPKGPTTVGRSKGRHMRRSILVVVLSTIMVMAMGATAFAGEITGNGKPTPVSEYRAGSICSFSGQNDDPHEPGLFNDGRVQSFGDIVQEAIGVLGDGKGASALVPIIRGEGPGVSCRGYASQR